MRGIKYVRMDCGGGGGKLHVHCFIYSFTFDPFTRHNFWNFLLGAGFHAIMQPGIHQLQVQRYSGMPSCSKAKQ